MSSTNTTLAPLLSIRKYGTYPIYDFNPDSIGRSDKIRERMPTPIPAPQNHGVCGHCLRYAARLLKPGIVLVLAALFASLTASPQSPPPSQRAASSGPHATPMPKPAAARIAAPRADQAYQKGRHAEQSKDWETAFASYSEAAAYVPANQTYVAAREHARFQLAQSLSDLAERHLIAGDVPGARQELLHALQVDPNYSIAKERLATLPDLVQESSAVEAARASQACRTWRPSRERTLSTFAAPRIASTRNWGASSE